MKPNSCLYRAVKKVVEYQFGITGLSSEVFDAHNNGEGVPTGIIVDVIESALSSHGVKVSAVYGKINDPENFSRPDLIRDPEFVSAPCIGHEQNHVEGILPGEYFTGDMAIVLEQCK